MARATGVTYCYRVIYTHLSLCVGFDSAILTNDSGVKFVRLDYGCTPLQGYNRVKLNCTIFFT